MAHRYFYKGKINLLVYGVGEIKPQSYVVSHSLITHPDFQEVGDANLEVKNIIEKPVSEFKVYTKKKKGRKKRNG